MNLWPVEHFLSKSASGQKVRKKVFNWSEAHLYWCNFLKIHILISLTCFFYFYLLLWWIKVRNLYNSRVFEVVYFIKEKGRLRNIVNVCLLKNSYFHIFVFWFILSLFFGLKFYLNWYRKVYFGDVTDQYTILKIIIKDRELMKVHLSIVLLIWSESCNFWLLICVSFPDWISCTFVSLASFLLILLIVNKIPCSTIANKIGIWTPSSHISM